MADVINALNALHQAYALYAQKSEAWQKRYIANGGQIHCGAGCFSCCNMPIWVSLVEALYMAEHLTPAEQKAVAKHARAVVRNAKNAPNDEVYVQRHRVDVGYCPLLSVHDGGCTRYGQRPTRCRDTFSAFPAEYCAAGYVENLTSKQRAAYQRKVERTPATDGETHFVAPLEHLSEDIWNVAMRQMRRHWRLEVWGDFWTLTTLAQDECFMRAVEQAQKRQALQRARELGLYHGNILQFS